MFYIPHRSSGVKRDYTTCVNKRAANLRFSSMKDKEKVASIEHLTMSNNISQIGNHSACFLSSVIASRPCHDPASAVSQSCLSCVTILSHLCHANIMLEQNKTMLLFFNRPAAPFQRNRL